MIEDQLTNEEFWQALKDKNHAKAVSTIDQYAMSHDHLLKLLNENILDYLKLQDKSPATQSLFLDTMTPIQIHKLNCQSLLVYRQLLTMETAIYRGEKKKPRSTTAGISLQLKIPTNSPNSGKESAHSEPPSPNTPVSLEEMSPMASPAMKDTVETISAFLEEKKLDESVTVSPKMPINLEKPDTTQDKVKKLDALLEGMMFGPLEEEVNIEELLENHPKETKAEPLKKEDEASLFKCPPGVPVNPDYFAPKPDTAKPQVKKIVAEPESYFSYGLSTFSHLLNKTVSLAKEAAEVGVTSIVPSSYKPGGR